MKRYDARLEWGVVVMEEESDGEYVLFEDVKDLEEKLAYQTARADANWRALCACRGEEKE
jgi:hypothetical protein